MQDLAWTRDLLKLPAAARTDMFGLIQLTLSRYPDLDLDMEAFKFVDYYQSSKIKSLPRTWFNWLKKAQNGYGATKSNDRTQHFKDYLKKRQKVEHDYR